MCRQDACGGHYRVYIYIGVYNRVHDGHHHRIYHRSYHCHHYRVYYRVDYRGRRGGVYYRHGELPGEDESIAMQ